MTSPVSAIEAIEKAMEGVTPGTWVAHQTVIHGVAYGGHWVEVADDDQRIQISGSGGARSYTQRVFDTQGHDDNEANARYIAACNPVAMREVLALARQAEALQRENAEKDARIAALEAALIAVEDGAVILGANEVVSAAAMKQVRTVLAIPTGTSGEKS